MLYHTHVHRYSNQSINFIQGPPPPPPNRRPPTNRNPPPPPPQRVNQARQNRGIPQHAQNNRGVPAPPPVNWLLYCFKKKIDLSQVKTQNLFLSCLICNVKIMCELVWCVFLIVVYQKKSVISKYNKFWIDEKS